MTVVALLTLHIETLSSSITPTINPSRQYYSRDHYLANAHQTTRYVTVFSQKLDVMAFYTGTG